MISAFMQIRNKCKANKLLKEGNKLKPNKTCNNIHRKTKEYRNEKKKEHKIKEKTSGITFTSFQTTFLSEDFSRI